VEIQGSEKERQSPRQTIKVDRYKIWATCRTWIMAWTG